MAGMFANAQKVAAPAKKGRKVEAETVTLAGMERFAALDAAIKTLTALREAEEASLKGLMADRFIEVGCKAKKRPANFNGVEGSATGSCQLKVRSTASVLSEDDQALLTEHEIKFGTNVKTQEAFLINPAYTNNMALLAKVEEALEGVDLPEDFLMKQEEVSVCVATEESIEAIFTKDKEIAEILLPVVTTLAIRPKIEGDDFWGILDEIMNPSEAVAA